MNLQDLGVQEMNKQELTDVDGGFWIEVLIGASIGLAVEIINDWDHFKAGVAAGWN